LSEILPSSGLGLGPDEVGKKDLKLLLMTSFTKNPKPKKILFHCRLEDLPSLLRTWTAL